MLVEGAVDEMAEICSLTATNLFVEGKSYV